MKIVNRSLTIFAVEAALGLWHGPRMRASVTRAGGGFLTIFILTGFVVGLAIGNPMKGILGGTAVGAVLALLVWLLDSRSKA